MLDTIRLIVYINMLDTIRVIVYINMLDTVRPLVYIGLLPAEETMPLLKDDESLMTMMCGFRSIPVKLHYSLRCEGASL